MRYLTGRCSFALDVANQFLALHKSFSFYPSRKTSSILCTVFLCLESSTVIQYAVSCLTNEEDNRKETVGACAMNTILGSKWEDFTGPLTPLSSVERQHNGP